MTWNLWFYHEDKERWVHWLSGSLEDCLEDLFFWRMGNYQSYTKMRIEAEREA